MCIPYKAIISSRGALPQCRPRPPQRRIAARQRSRFLIRWPPECPRRCLQRFQVKGNGTHIFSHHLFAGYATVHVMGYWVTILIEATFIGFSICMYLPGNVQTIQTSAQDVQEYSNNVCHEV